MTDGVRDGTNIVDVYDGQTYDLLNLIDLMQQDWVQLNEFLNRTAIHYHWCSDWEERISRYNYHFKVLKLEGRPEESDYGSAHDEFLLPSLRRLTPEDQKQFIEEEKRIFEADARRKAKLRQIEEENRRLDEQLRVRKATAEEVREIQEALRPVSDARLETMYRTGGGAGGRLHANIVRPVHIDGPDEPRFRPVDPFGDPRRPPYPGGAGGSGGGEGILSAEVHRVEHGVIRRSWDGSIPRVVDEDDGDEEVPW